MSSNDDSRRYRDRVRAETFEQYGGAVCACCGETEPSFLSLNHINGGGNKQRAELALDAKRTATNPSKSQGGWHFYKWLKSQGWPDGFNVLCHNCNQATANGRVCPHKRGKDV